MSNKYKLGVVGNPIEHSLSPFIHSRFARSENIHIEYLPYKVNDIDFDQFIKEFFNDPLSKGLNVTLPYKKKAAEIDGDISNEARFINAVNTIEKDNNNIYLHSTDGIGFITDIKEDKSFNFEDTNILFIGAGASAESILYKVAQEKPRHISIMNRTEEKADRLIRKFSNISSIDNAKDSSCNFDLIINCSSAGLTGDFEPVQEICVTKNAFFYDLNYSLVETPFCKWASEKSDKVFDGIGMLVHQAAHSFNIWFKVFPETKSVLSDLQSMRE